MVDFSKCVPEAIRAQFVRKQEFNAHCAADDPRSRTSEKDSHTVQLHVLCQCAARGAPKLRDLMQTLSILMHALFSTEIVLVCVCALFRQNPPKM